MTLNRREAVIRMATLMGASVLGPRLFAATFEQKDGTAGSGFSSEDVALLDELGETIIPATDIPGAKAVQIGAFIAMMIDDCYERLEQTAFKEALHSMATSYRRRFGVDFVASRAADRTAFLNELDQQQKSAGVTTTPTASVRLFRLLKELTILGYFTSEIGCTQALRFTEVPGRYDGCAPYKKGDRAWTS
jgi:hypothetical protein